MYWIKEMQSAIGFIENRLTEEISIEDVARSANASSANFQRIFSNAVCCPTKRSNTEKLDERQCKMTCRQ